MKHVRCPECHRMSPIRPSMLGTEVECPHCGAPFVAQPTHGHHAGRPKSSMALIWLGGIAGAVVLVWIGAKVLTSTLNKPSQIQLDALAAQEKRLAEEKAKEPKLKPVATAADLQKRIDEYLRALDAGDRALLADLVSWERLHDSRAAFDEPDGRRWSNLNPDRQGASRGRMVEQIFGNEETRAFLAEAEVVKRDVSTSLVEANVKLVHASKLDPKVTQSRTVTFYDEDGKWYLSKVTTDAILRPQKKAAPGEGPSVEDLLKTIVKQDAPAGTSPDVIARADAQVAILTDVSKTSEQSAAREELKRIGDPAIPSLLNAIVAHIDLDTTNDQIVVNTVVQTLRDMTGQPYSFLPGSEFGGGGEHYADNVKQLGNWFTWWKSKKKSS